MGTKNKKFKVRQVIFACLLFVLIALLLSACTSLSSTEPTVIELDINAEVTENGDLMLTERHVLSFPNRKSEWWNYNRVVDLSFNGQNNGHQKIPVDPDSYKMWVNDIEYPLYGSANLDSYSATHWQQEINEESYYYKNGNKLELGVVMPKFTRGMQTVTFQYKITNVLINYQDVYGLYYQFVPSGNTMDIQKFTANIKIPQSKADQTFAWLHLSTGDGGIEILKNASGEADGVKIEAQDVPSGVYLETRLLMDKTTIAPNNKFVSDSATLNTIKEQEQKWFDDFQTELEIARIAYIIDIGVAITSIILSVGLTVLFLHLKRPPKVDDALEYVRDVPEDWTSEEASHLFWHYQKGSHTEDRISATILSLARKKYLEILPGEGKKKAVISVIKTEKDGLLDFEGIVMGLLEQVSPNGEPFTMNEFEQWSKMNANYVSQQIQNYEVSTKRRAAKAGYLNVNTRFDKIASTLSIVFIALGALILVNAFFMQIIKINMTFAGFGLLIGGCILLSVKHKVAPLLEEGQKKHMYFKAFARYMTDFSNLKEHELPALILWEEYMVWATAMGIADKVAEQLEIAYPEYREMVTSGSYNNTFLLLYLLSPRLRFSVGLNLVSNVSGVMNTVHSVQRAQRAAAMASKFGSSGGGGRGGGGFRGGGGGFGGGGSMGSR